jgi:hypothetical protein
LGHRGRTEFAVEQGWVAEPVAKQAESLWASLVAAESKLA